MSNEKMREEFEAWHKTEVANFVAAGEMQAARVLSEFKQTALAIWEASRAALVIDLPPGGYWAGYDNEHMMESRDVREAIESAGLRVKP